MSTDARTFTGTIPDFLDWVAEQLTYGSISIGEPRASEVDQTILARRVSMVTGGFSDDEALLAAVNNDMFSHLFWSSTHSGGLYVYEVPASWFESEQSVAWLGGTPADTMPLGGFTTLTLKIAGAPDISIEIPAGHGLRLRESDGDEIIIETV